MPAHGRPVDKYTERRRKEQAERRKAAWAAAVEAAPKPVRPRNRPTTKAQASARVMLDVLQGLPPLPRTGPPEGWTHEEDLELLRLIASGASFPEAVEPIRKVRPASAGSLWDRFDRLKRMYG